MQAGVRAEPTLVISEHGVWNWGSVIDLCGRQGKLVLHFFETELSVDWENLPQTIHQTGAEADSRAQDPLSIVTARQENPRSRHSFVIVTVPTMQQAGLDLFRDSY